MNNDELDERSLKFGFDLVTKSPKTSETYSPAFYNSTYKTFCCYDESNMQVWDPCTGKILYSCNTIFASKTHKIINAIFVKSHEVTYCLPLRFIWPQQKTLSF
jgi:hypothetical protein